MTVGEWLENISSLVKEFPEILSYAVVCDRDGYVDEVLFYPQVGHWDPGSSAFRKGTNNANALCIT